jgi:hypothetical protein
MTTKLTCQGWEIYFHPQLFGQQYQEILARVQKLQATLAPDDYILNATQDWTFQQRPKMLVSNTSGSF